MRTGESASCGNLGFYTFAQGASPSLDLERANPGGVVMFPLGLALLGGGLILSGAALVLDDLGEDWWLPLVLSAGFGVVSYGIGAWSNPR